MEQCQPNGGSGRRGAEGGVSLRASRDSQPPPPLSPAARDCPVPMPGPRPGSRSSMSLEMGTSPCAPGLTSQLHCISCCMSLDKPSHLPVGLSSSSVKWRDDPETSSQQGDSPKGRMVSLRAESCHYFLDEVRQERGMPGGRPSGLAETTHQAPCSQELRHGEVTVEGLAVLGPTVLV